MAIDVAGTAHGADEQYEESVVQVFQEAAKRGIHRTVHAGESGGPREIFRVGGRAKATSSRVQALTEMHAERIGHGYRVMMDPELYRERFLDRRDTHLEACPYSSVMTGAVKFDWPHHPIVQ